MAFNRFTKNVLNVSGLPDRVQNQAQALKATFDQAGVDIKQALNGLISELEAATSASNLGADVSSVTTKTVQAILTAFELEIANRYTKNEIDTLVSGNTNDLVADVDVNLTTGVITVTKKDGAVEKFDTALEKVPAKFEIVESGTSLFLKITNVDGTSTQTNITDLMNIYDFNNTNDIAFNVSGTGNEKVVTASIRPNSIGLDKLSLSVMTTLEGYMTSARDSASAAKISETNARNSANTATKAAEKASIAEGLANTAINKATEAESYAHGGTGSREGEDTDNAKYYSQIAKQVAGGDFVTTVEMEAYAQKKGTVPSFEGEELSGDVIEVDSLLAIESKLKISGNSEQDSRSGKNLLKNIRRTGTQSGITFTINPDKSITLNGTATAVIYYNFCGYVEGEEGSYYFTLEKGKKYTSYLKGWVSGIRMNTRTYTQNTSLLSVNASEINTQTYSGETDEKAYSYLSIPEGTTLNNVTVYPMILEGEYTLETAEPYEPYGAMPSPDYPSEIRSVKSKSDNLFDITKVTVGKYLNKEGLWIPTDYTNTSDYILLEANQTYVFSYDYGTLAHEGDRDCFFLDKDKKILNYFPLYVTNASKKLVIKPTTDCYLVICYDKNFTNIMLNKGDKALPYQPYGYVPVEAKVEGKNLFDKDNFETLHLGIDNNTKVFYNASTFNSFYIKCKSNTTYTVGKISSKRFTIATCIDIPIADGVATNLVGKDNGTQLTITSGINDKYLWVYYYKSDTDTLTEQEILDTIQIEEGSTATAYEPYKGKTISLPLGDIELRSTPDGTRDTFARVGGVWNKVEKIIPFTITEDMVIVVNLDYYAVPIASVLRPTGAISELKGNVCLMTSYKQRLAGGEQKHGLFFTGGSNTRIEIFNENITDLATAKTILAGETGIIKRAEPTYIPITDTALIQALDTLEQLILHKGYNRITVTSVNGVKAYLDLSIPPTALVTNVVEIDSELDMPIPVVSNTGDVKVKIPAKNQMTLNPSTGEVNVKGLKINGQDVATQAFVQGLVGEIVSGSYEGNDPGGSSEEGYSGTERNISLGFRPKLLILYGYQDAANYNMVFGFATKDDFLGYNNSGGGEIDWRYDYSIPIITDDGFKISGKNSKASNAFSGYNADDVYYKYIAW